MIWFFDKDGDKLRYEITRDRVGGRYRVVITRPDGSETVEEVDEPTELIERSVQLRNALRGDGWKVAEQAGVASARQRILEKSYISIDASSAIAPPRSSA